MKREEKGKGRKRKDNYLVVSHNVIQAKQELGFPDLLCLCGSRLGLELEKLAWNLRGRS